MGHAVIDLATEKSARHSNLYFIPADDQTPAGADFIGLTNSNPFTLKVSSNALPMNGRPGVLHERKDIEAEQNSTDSNIRINATHALNIVEAFEASGWKLVGWDCGEQKVRATDQSPSTSHKATIPKCFQKIAATQRHLRSPESKSGPTSPSSTLHTLFYRANR